MKEREITKKQMEGVKKRAITSLKHPINEIIVRLNIFTAEGR